MILVTRVIPLILSLGSLKTVIFVIQACIGVDGEKSVPRWNTTKIWVGHDSTPPPVDLADLDSGEIVKKIQKLYTTPLPNLVKIFSKYLLRFFCNSIYILSILP